MLQFGDAKELVSHSGAKLEKIRVLHQKCLNEQVVEPALLIEIKNLMENLRSALDYCASALFEKYGRSKKAHPKVYFPYAKLSEDKNKFRAEIVDRCLPGVLGSRPDIAEKLESYQHFGNTGNWLALFIELTNENKHQRLSPQIHKHYKMACISGSIPPGGMVEIDLSRIPLGTSPDGTYRAIGGTWTGLEFTANGAPVLPLLEHAFTVIRSIVNELSSL